MKKIVISIVVASIVSFNFLSSPFENKINQFIVSQKKYLRYTPKTPEENADMKISFGKIFSKDALFQKNVILYRKNNLPDNRKPNYYISYTFLKYKDSTQCKDALSVWMNCFGGDCTKVKFMEDMEGFKTTPMFIIINSDEILIAQTQCELSYEPLYPQNKSNIWKTVIDEFKNHFSKDNSIYAEVGCGGPLRWTKK